MRFSEHNKVLNLVVDNDFDWLELFDTEHKGVILIALNSENIDFFFPGWRDYADMDNVGDSLRYEDANRFHAIHITIEDGVMSKEGEGDYEVLDYHFASQEDDGGEAISIPADDELAECGYLIFTVRPEEPVL